MSVDDQNSVEIILTPIRYIRVIGVLLGFVFLPVAWVFILWGTTFSVILGVMVNLAILWIIAKVLLSKIGYNGEILVIKGILRKNELEISRISNISKIRLFGTVGRVPLSVSSVLFTFKDGTEQRLGFRIFAYQQIVAILEDISSQIDLV